MEAKTTIYTKLLEFQKKGISIKKDKRNPHFKNDYASLNEVLDKVKEELNKLGVVILQTPGCDRHGDNANAGLWTYLIDTESDTRTEGFVPFINATDMQKLGGAITYARRYALVSMLALEDEDDDGNTASSPAPKMTVEQAFVELRKAVNLDTLKQAFTSLPPAIQKDVEVIALKDELKAALTI